jgi:hypothetical protein
MSPVPAVTVDAAPKDVPLRFTYTGVMEIAGSAQIDIATLKPGMIRLRREESNPIGNPGARNPASTIGRTNQLIDAGIAVCPCIETDNFSSVAAFTAYLEDWIAGVDEPPEFWECGNEPDSYWPPDASDPDFPADLNHPDNWSPTEVAFYQQSVRTKYLKYMTAASDVLDPLGLKLVLAAQISGNKSAGGQENVLDDIDDGLQGSDTDQVDALAIHPYAQEADDVYDSVQGYRNNIDSHPGFNGKDVWVTEVGWPATYRQDGSGYQDGTPNNPDDWNNQPSNHLHVNRIITTAQQSGKLKACFDLLTIHRFSLKLAAVIWFAYHDYGIPNGTWDRHCGVLDFGEGKRTSYNTLKNYQRTFSR